MESASNDFWYTPPHILETVRLVIGDYFDPCPIDSQFDGLNIMWGGVAFINPPYSRKLKRAFILKGEEEFSKYRGSYIWLMNYANSEDLKIIKSKASAVCLPHQRIQFIPGKQELGDGKSPRYDNIIFMWGGDVMKFKKHFSKIGHCFFSFGSHS